MRVLALTLLLFTPSLNAAKCAYGKLHPQGALVAVLDDPGVRKAIERRFKQFPTLGKKMTLDDIFQELSLELWKDPERRFTDDLARRHFVIRVASRTILDLYREAAASKRGHGWRRQVAPAGRPSRDPIKSLVEPREVDPLAKLITDEMLDGLTEEERYLVQRHIVEGASFSELASELVSAEKDPKGHGAIRVQFFRQIARIKKELKEDEPRQSTRD